MSLFPSKENSIENGLSLHFYAKDAVRATGEERELLIGKPNLVPGTVEHELAEIIHGLFMHQHHYSHQHPRTNPTLPPEKRFTRHRNYYIWLLNQFRHWWKTSRLLVRLSGGLVYCEDAFNWAGMAVWDVSHKKQARHALKIVKKIGRGGPIEPFLKQVHPFTRSVRIILAVARGWEARVDNRLYEVGIAEAFAFMGNRCSRYWARQVTAWLSLHVAFPFSAKFLAPYLEQNTRPIIIAMGFLRAILPFAASFQGSRVGRQLVKYRSCLDDRFPPYCINSSFRVGFRRSIRTSLPATGEFKSGKKRL